MINPDEIKIELYTKRQVGGQQVGIQDHSIKLTHLPTEITIIVSHERSQWRNREIALHALEGALTSPAFRG